MPLNLSRLIQDAKLANVPPPFVSGGFTLAVRLKRRSPPASKRADPSASQLTCYPQCLQYQKGGMGSGSGAVRA